MPRAHFPLATSEKLQSFSGSLRRDARDQAGQQQGLGWLQPPQGWLPEGLLLRTSDTSTACSQLSPRRRLELGQCHPLSTASSHRAGVGRSLQSPCGDAVERKPSPDQTRSVGLLFRVTAQALLSSSLLVLAQFSSCTAFQSSQAWF